MKTALPSQSLDQLFYTARTPKEWTDQLVEDAMVHRLYDLLKWGPTASNVSAGRLPACDEQFS